VNKLLNLMNCLAYLLAVSHSDKINSDAVQIVEETMRKIVECHLRVYCLKKSTKIQEANFLVIVEVA